MTKQQVAYFGVICIIIVVSASDYNIEGYSTGYVTNCLGAWKPPVIDPKRLFISVMGPGTASLTSYNYYQMRKLARNPGIDFQKKTFLYVGSHVGFTIPLGRNIAHLYKNLGYNVFVFDIPDFTTTYYPEAASFVRPLGKRVAEMLANLTSLGLDPKKLELVGQGTGGHTMSFIAKNYRQITGRNISSLTALDPAGPCFRTLGPEGRLDPSDADFVLSVATNIDGLGIATPVGHVTFYVNGGEFQPIDVWFLPCALECSDTKAFVYWISALINPQIFIGVQCDTIQQAREGDCYDRTPKVWNSMDLFTDRSKPGIYYLPISHKYPYGLGSKGLKKGSGSISKFLSSLFNEADAYATQHRTWLRQKRLQLVYGLQKFVGSDRIK